jgi:ABC-type multidrug transport system ATPase subunit/pSer/pThr/pTyr-binding forkhead associated (FHA) protein
MRRNFKSMDAANDPSTLGYIRFLTGPLAGEAFPISKPITTLGREPTNDIVISDPAVSRHHAQLLWSNGTWSIRKLASQNTLTVNRHDVQQSPLGERDTIGLGTGTTFLLELNKRSQQAPSPADNYNRVQQLPFSADSNKVQQLPYSSPGGQQPGAAAPSPRSAAAPPGNFFQQGFAPGPNPAIQLQPISSAPPAPPMQHVGPTGTERESFDQTMRSPDNTQQSTVPTLEISTNTDHEKHTYPLTQAVIDIGRDPGNTIVINRPTVSSFHLQIIREGNDLVLIHPHPKRGRTLNGIDFKGVSIPGDQAFRRVLTRSDVFRISDENGTFVTLSYNDGSGASQEALPDIRPIPLGQQTITIGRLPGNTVVLNHPQVSGNHARLEMVQSPGPGYRIIDLGSTNHVYVNGQRVNSQQLKPGDEIRIGPFKLTYTGTQLTQQDESHSIRIDALDLVKAGNKNVILLNDISLVIPPRKFVALVGGSGAGKSTLMDALNGLRPAQKGLVLYNGQDYYHHLAAFSTQLGYVPQDDIIHRDLSVERALHYAAKLRLPDDFTNEQIKQRIDEVLADVDMKKQRNLLVSRLSGGQRKRVSIALELLANPSVFFLDEPTSGLDPGLDRKMMLLMRKLADRGRTIVLVTHATNNINACDYVCFLSRGGNLAYFGPPNDCKAYFGKTDFAEIYTSLEPTDENPNIPVEAGARFKQSPDYARYVRGPLESGPAGRASIQMPTAVAKPPKRGNPWRQFRILAARYLELLKNDAGNLAILLLQAPIIGIVLFFLTGSGTFGPHSIVDCPTRQNILASSGPIVSHDCQRVLDFLNNNPAGQALVTSNHTTSINLLQSFIVPGSGGDAQKILFIMAFAAVLFGCINGSREIVKEAAIYRRERAVNLGIIPYMFSKFVVLGALCLLQSFVLVLLVNLKSPFETSVFLPPAIEIYITMALTSLAGLMTGLVISAIVPNNDRAMSLVPLALLPQVIFAGVIFSLDNPQALQVLGAFFPARWAMAAMGTSIGLHSDKLGADGFSNYGSLFSVDHTHADAFAHLLLCWFILALIIVLFGAAIGWFLKRKDVRA